MPLMTTVAGPMHHVSGCRSPLCAGATASLLFLAMLAVPARAQTVAGQLLDAPHRQPLASASMSLLEGDAPVVTTATAADGSFLLQAPRAGTFRLRAELVGYDAVETTLFDIAAGDTLRLEFRMAMKPVTLSALRVPASAGASAPRSMAGFHERQRAGLGATFFDRERILRMRPLCTSELFRDIAGVRLMPAARGTGNVVLFRGGCAPQFFIDAVPVELRNLTIDDLVRPLDLDGVEVYRGTTGLPTEFARSTCGTVLIWTRNGLVE